jgi:hypothetical protein
LKEIRKDTFVGAKVQHLILPAIRNIARGSFDDLEDLLELRFLRAARGVFDLPSPLFGWGDKWYPVTIRRRLFEMLGRHQLPE